MIDLNMRLLKLQLKFKEANHIMPNLLKCGKQEIFELKNDVYLARFFRLTEQGLFLNGMQIVCDETISGYVMEFVQ